MSACGSSKGKTNFFSSKIHSKIHISLRSLEDPSLRYIKDIHQEPIWVEIIAKKREILKFVDEDPYGSILFSLSICSLIM